MAKKSIGYIKLEWTCPACGTKNPGPNQFCTACGAPQPEDVEFEQPAQAEILTDEAEIARAKAGPDKHCPYCGARNPSDAGFCGACGGDLSEAALREHGKVLGAFREGQAESVRCPACQTENDAQAVKCKACGAQLRTESKPEHPSTDAQAQSATPSAGRGRSAATTPIMIGGVLLVLCLCVAAAYFLFFRTQDVVAEVQAVSWERSIAILALVDVEGQDWQSDIPSDAPAFDCESRLYETQDEPAPDAVEVCGTPYTVDEGSGFGEVVQDCVYEIYEPYCSYTYQDWGVVDTVTISGQDLSPSWPTTSLLAGQREGEREQTYRVEFEADGEDYTYTTEDPDRFAEFTPGSRWRLEINTLGGVVSAEPLQ